MNIKSKRIAALIIDLLIINIIVNIISNFFIVESHFGNFKFLKINFNYGYSLVIIFQLLYFFIFDILNKSKTLGKIALKINTVLINEEEFDLKNRLCRSFLKIISILISPISLILFLIKSYTIQDSICKTKTTNK